MVSCCGDGDVGFVSEGDGRRKEEKKENGDGILRDEFAMQ